MLVIRGIITSHKPQVIPPLIVKMLVMRFGVYESIRSIRSIRSMRCRRVLRFGARRAMQDGSLRRMQRRTRVWAYGEKERLFSANSLWKPDKAEPLIP